MVSACSFFAKLYNLKKQLECLIAKRTAGENSFLQPIFFNIASCNCLKTMQKRCIIPTCMKVDAACTSVAAKLVTCQLLWEWQAKHCYLLSLLFWVKLQRSKLHETHHNFIAVVQALRGFVLYKLWLALWCTRFGWPALQMFIGFVLQASMASVWLASISFCATSLHWLLCSKPHNGCVWQAFLGFFLKLSMALSCKPSNGLVHSLETNVCVCMCHAFLCLQCWLIFALPGPNCWNKEFQRSNKQP